MTDMPPPPPPRPSSSPTPPPPPPTVPTVPTAPPTAPPTGPASTSWSPGSSFGGTPPPPIDPKRRTDGGGRAIVVVAAIGVVALIALVAAVVVLVTGGDDDVAIESPPVPAITVPAITVPANTVPAITVPDVEAPVDPVSETPGITVPSITVPSITVPSNTVPSIAVPTVTVPEPDVVDLFAGTGAAEVVDEVAAARGADPLRILRAVIYPEYAFVQVQDPTILENVDEYRWRGTLAEPSPVRLVGTGDLEDSLYSADEADWAVIPALVAAAPTLTEIPDGAVTHVIVERPLPFSADVRMRVFVNGERNSGYVDADALGNVLDVARS